MKIKICCLLKCPCGLYYVGKTIRELKIRIGEHKSNIRNKDETWCTWCLLIEISGNWYCATPFCIYIIPESLYSLCQGEGGSYYAQVLLSWDTRWGRLDAETCLCLFALSVLLLCNKVPWMDSGVLAIHPFTHSLTQRNVCPATKEWKIFLSGAWDLDTRL